jgi:DNA-binding Lrp family transcriptional regulator
MTNCAFRYRMKYGDLTRTILAAVDETQRTTPRDLADELNERGLRISAHHISVRLAELAADGRIERLGKGVYAPLERVG